MVPDTSPFAKANQLAAELFQLFVYRGSTLLQEDHGVALCLHHTMALSYAENWHRLYPALHKPV